MAGVPRAVHGAFIAGSPVVERPKGAGPVAAGVRITGVDLKISVNDALPIYLALLLTLTLFLALFLNTPGLRAVLFPGQVNSDLPATLLAALIVIGSFKYRAFV